MDRKDLERFRTQLLAKRADLLDRVKSARDSEQSTDTEEAPDLGDRALSTVSRDLMYQLTGSERDLVKRINQALERIVDGTFGACVNCGAAIHAARLEAVPWARHCIDCQELQDRGEL
jgi:DnaK suppressor protein